MGKLRLIQCGVGGHGRAWWDGVVDRSPDFDLVAIVDIAEAVLHEVGDRLNLPRGQRFASLPAALQHVSADAVLTVTPPPVHLEHAKLAFARGLHLLTEKPIAHDLPAAKLMVELARRAGRQLLVAQNYRYSPLMQKLQALMRDKSAGEFGHGHVDFYLPADFTGSFRETMHYPLLIDMAIHHVDLIRAVTARNITRISAQTFNPPWSWYRHHAGLKMLMQLEGDRAFSYSGDWSARGRSTSWNGAWRLQCSDGSIHVEDDRITIVRCEKWNRNPSLQEIDAPEIAVKQQAALLLRFAEAIRSGHPAETSGEDNLKSFAAVMAAVESARENGRWTDVA